MQHGSLCTEFQKNDQLFLNEFEFPRSTLDKGTLEAIAIPIAMHTYTRFSQFTFILYQFNDDYFILSHPGMKRTSTRNMPHACMRSVRLHYFHPRRGDIAMSVMYTMIWQNLSSIVKFGVDDCTMYSYCLRHAVYF